MWSICNSLWQTNFPSSSWQEANHDAWCIWSIFRWLVYTADKSTLPTFYVPFDACTMVHFTSAHLAKLHKQLFHPSATKLFNFLKRAWPEHATPEALELLNTSIQDVMHVNVSNVVLSALESRSEPKTSDSTKGSCFISCSLIRVQSFTSLMRSLGFQQPDFFRISAPWKSGTHFCGATRLSKSVCQTGS